MSMTAFTALVRRDLRLFFLDKRAMTMSFAAPILIGSFFGYLFGGVTNREPSKIGVSVVDRDSGPIAKRVVAALSGDKALEVKLAELDKAREAVRTGKSTVAVGGAWGVGRPAPAGVFPGRN